MRTYAWAAACGVLMGIALVVAHVTRPEVIQGWLDFTGDWDPTLFMFFAPAAAAYHGMMRWARARERAKTGPVLCLPARGRIDAKLIAGAAIFGIGWSIGGSCPGPALASLGAGAPWAFVFVAAMMIGFIGGDYFAALFDGAPSARNPHAVKAVRNALR